MDIDQQWLVDKFPEFTDLRPLGQGGQKLVFAGKHEHDGNTVLKLFHPASEPQRVVREVEAVQSIQSPRVPEILDVGTLQAPIGQVIWVREQRVNGSDLRNIISNGILDRITALEVSKQVLEALVTAESNRIVHRDVKPDNIMVGLERDVYLLDFGVARHLDEESITATAHVFGVGTPGYAPPEQFRNRKQEIDSRSDLFALGVTLYEFVEGENPFVLGARDVSERIHRVETQPLPRIENSVGGGSAFQDLVLAMTRIRRDHRPSSAQEALQWIQEICDAEQS